MRALGRSRRPGLSTYPLLNSKAATAIIVGLVALKAWAVVEQHQCNQPSAARRPGGDIFAADAIGPHCGTVRVDLFNEREPQRVAESKVISPKIIQQIWDDFAPFRAGATANAPR